MVLHTDHLWFKTEQRQQIVRITDQIEGTVWQGGVRDGTALVSAIHRTAGVYVDDWEDGLIEDITVWLERLARPGCPPEIGPVRIMPKDILRRTVVGHQILVPVTDGRLDLGPWEQNFYA